LSCGSGSFLIGASGLSRDVAGFRSGGDLIPSCFRNPNVVAGAFEGGFELVLTSSPA
jgi:hypothetical protein